MTPQLKLKMAKRKWDRSRTATKEAREALNDVIRETAPELGQAEVGRVLEWPRQRVHSLLEDS